MRILGFIPKSKMTINIINVRSDRKGFETISKIANDIKESNPKFVKLDFSQCSFFEANMSSALYAVLGDFIKRGAFECINMQENVKKVFSKNQFLLTLNMQVLSDINKTMLPFRIFEVNDESPFEFMKYLECYLKGKGIPKMTNELTKKFHQNLLEILINAIMHSGTPYGVCSCGQYYPHDRRLDFTISDAGVGIKENVVRYTGKKMSATDAIKWALESGNTTREGSTPGGLGLNLLREFISFNGGKLQIISNEGYYELSNGQENLRKIKDMNYSFPGTSINVEINANDKKAYCLKSEVLPKK